MEHGKSCHLSKLFKTFIVFGSLISKFTVSTTSHQHVRIAEARLDLPPSGLDGVGIQPASSHKRVIVCIFTEFLEEA